MFAPAQNFGSFIRVPRPGEVGHETWLDEGWKGRSGVNVWGWYVTVDEDRGIVYMTFGAQAANYYGGDRPGANLFANSVVAVDAATGKYKWHFQTIHHDLWDSDLPPAPGLVDIVKDGKKFQPWPRSERPVGCSFWIASRESQCSASRSVPFPMAMCAASGIRRRSRSR
jgi:quinoprotein glucose dehydrogenase